MSFLDRIKNKIKKEKTNTQQPVLKQEHEDYKVLNQDSNKYFFVADIISSLSIFSTEEEIKEAFEMIEKLPSKNKLKDYIDIANWLPEYVSYIPELYRNMYDEKLDLPILYKTMIKASPTNVKYIPVVDRSENLLCFTSDQINDTTSKSFVSDKVFEERRNKCLVKVIDAFPADIREKNFYSNIRGEAFNACANKAYKAQGDEE